MCLNVSNLVQYIEQKIKSSLTENLKTLVKNQNEKFDECMSKYSWSSFTGKKHRVFINSNISQKNFLLTSNFNQPRWYLFTFIQFNFSWKENRKLQISQTSKHYLQFFAISSVSDKPKSTVLFRLFRNICYL